MKSVIIIGAGVGGLALANMLASAGMQVSVYEKNSGPGGRAGRFDAEDFRFDTGPSWYLMPEVFSHYYDLFGKDVNKQLDLVRLDPGYKVTFHDGESLLISGNEKQDYETFESLEPGSSIRLKKYLHQSAKTYDLATKYFLYNNFDSILNVANKDVLYAGPKMMRFAGKSLHGNVKKYFKNPKLQKVVEYPAVFLGASPYSAPAIYSLMSHLDFKQGVFYPQGGLYEIIESLVSIGQELGVTYHYNSPVQKIITNNGLAVGVKLATHDQHADVVVSNADMHFTETKLLPSPLQTYPQKYWDKRIPGPSAVLVYLGIKGELSNFEHHNLFFTKQWKQNFTYIFKNKFWPSPASMYVCVPGKTDKSVAPKGHENVFILVPGPAKLGQTKNQLNELADQYIAQLSEVAATPDLANRITYKKVYGPGDFAQDFHAWQGTALGMAHTLRQSAMFRPQNKSKKVKNLYYVGSGTVPGIGIPMCLISAELVYKRLVGDKTSGPIKSINKL